MKSKKSHDCYIKDLLEINSYYKNGDFEVISIYNGDNNKITVRDEFGFLELKAGKLLLDRRPSIRCAVDKNEYFKNKIIKVYGNSLDLSKVDYSEAHKDIKIICKTHGEFEIDPMYLISNRKPGCLKCKKLKGNKTIDNGGWGLKNWWHKADKSKNFDSFKMYIIRCWNENEIFYKVGRTFCTVNSRFSSKEAMPYNYEIVQIRESFDALKIYCLEKVFKKYNSENKYNPQISFDGKQECFTKIIDINNGKEIK